MKATSAKSARARREQGARIQRWTRLAVQIVFFVLAPSLFSAAFNGVKYVFTQLGSSLPLEATSFLVLLAGVLAFTIVFGRFFCGYACAFGTLGDVVYALVNLTWKKTGLAHPQFPEKLVRMLSLAKYAVLAGICLMCFVGVWSSVSGMSPWVPFAGIIGGTLEGIDVVAFVLLGLIVVGMALRERFFCQFLCPLGAVFTLLPVLGCSTFTREKGRCAKSCGRCHGACPVSIWPDGDANTHGECIACGRCASLCPLENISLVAALPNAGASETKGAAGAKAEAEAPASAAIGCAAAGEAGKSAAPASAPAASSCDAPANPTAPATASAAAFDPPPRATRRPRVLLRGTEPTVVIVKALLLLLMCWVLGATRYLPAVQEVLPWLSF